MCTIIICSHFTFQPLEQPFACMLGWMVAFDLFQNAVSFSMCGVGVGFLTSIIKVDESEIGVHGTPEKPGPHCETLHTTGVGCPGVIWKSRTVLQARHMGSGRVLSRM